MEIHVCKQALSNKRSVSFSGCPPFVKSVTMTTTPSIMQQKEQTLWETGSDSSRFLLIQWIVNILMFGCINWRSYTE